MQTIKEVKEYLRENWEEGIDCPCCGQFVRKYKRPIHSTMARMLIRLYWLDNQKQGYYHASKMTDGISSTGTSDFSKLRYYGLVVEKPKDEENTKTRTSGFWGITHKGRLFVENKIKVQSHVIIYNKKKIGLTGDMVSIIDVLKKDFNYNELMKGTNEN